jgi:hypothetical protein
LLLFLGKETIQQLDIIGQCGIFRELYFLFGQK